ncbi:hypothetical protein ColLi_04445 [Colletotrichum liriopes]|uniref:Uncharacterized protein n=1 Tax=Colletotrichum liriopes TaxID=708192 RepID=A0AA37GJ06_9PEZI|nr:hypothetical protein ColLi_04445 [Colletotrichum liriopes]
MVNLSLLVTAALAATAEATVTYTWNNCKNAPKCNGVDAPGQIGTAGAVTGGGFVFYPGVYLFSYSKDTGFTYDSSNGYWYSHDTDGLYISPTGYVQFAHNMNRIGVQSKSNSVGSTFWRHGGSPCCLPDQVGKDIYDVTGYKMDY